MNIDILNALNVDVEKDAHLSNYTTFQLGGRCPFLVFCRNSHEVKGVVSLLLKEKMNFMLMGLGSNLLISDAGVYCAVIRYVNDRPQIQADGLTLIVDAATHLDDLVLFCAENGLSGLNFASGIPGTVGGAVCGNAGAFGKQISDVLFSVDLISRKGMVQKNVDSQTLGFSYRHSFMKENGSVILSAKFILKTADKKALLKERQEILDLRKRKHPDYSLLPTAGSFFRNIESSSQADKRKSAGWYLEEAGAQELDFNGAALFPKHANIIVKTSDCSAQDVFDLSEEMKKRVKEKFNIDLIREVRFAGKFKGQEKETRLIW